MEIIREDPIVHKKKKHIISLDSLAKIYFNDRLCIVCEHCKAFDKLSDNTKKINNSLICTYRKVGNYTPIFLIKTEK